MENIARGKGHASAQGKCGYGPIWLKRIGDRVSVEIEYQGAWVPVIEEHIDSSFSHCVHPQGIVEALKRQLPRESIIHENYSSSGEYLGETAFPDWTHD